MPFSEIFIPNANIKIIGIRDSDVENQEQELYNYQYQEVLEDLPNAEIIRVATYNFNIISKRDSTILNWFIHARPRDAKIILGVPGFLRDDNNRKDWEVSLKESLSQVDAYLYNCEIRINPFNHSKIIGTENKVYIGSQNISVGSQSNFESGVIIEDQNIVSNIYDCIFEKIWEKSIHVKDSMQRLEEIDIYNAINQIKNDN